MSDSLSPLNGFDYARLNDATVATMLKRGYSLHEIIGALSREKEQLYKRINELELIAPKKVQLPDGTVMVWQCPLNLVP